MYRSRTRLIVHSTPPHTGICMSYSELLEDPVGCRERLGDDLIHVVVLVGRQTADEPGSRLRLCELAVALVQLGVRGTRDRVVGITLVRRVLVDDGRRGRRLAGQLLELGDARVLVVERIVDHRRRLMLLARVRLELEAERPVREAS